MLHRAKELVLRLIYDETAGIMTMTAVMFPMLMGFAGLGIDITSWYMERRTTQSIVDTAAVDGAHHMRNYTETEMQALVTEFALTVGYNPPEDLIEINSPPLNGSRAGDTGFVEVINDRQATLYFISAFYALFNGEDFTVTVQSRGVAGSLDLGEACVVALSPNDNRALNFIGTTTVTSDCAIASNSTSASAIQVGGNANVSVSGASSVGGVREIGGADLTNINGGSSLIPDTSASAVNDPYDGVEVPIGASEDPLLAPDDDCVGSEDLFLGTPAGQPYVVADMGAPGVIGTDPDGNPPASVAVGDPFYTLSKGTYCNGLKIQGNVYFSPGTYVIRNGDFDANAGSIMWGDNISFFLTGEDPEDVGGVRDNGQVEIDFSATTTGEYTGILLFQDIRTPDGPDVTFNGGADMALDGVVYAPASQITINGGASAAPSCLKIYGYTLVFSGNSHVGNDDTVCNSIGLLGSGDTSRTRVQLVE